MPLPWEHLADELHSLGYSYGYTQALFPDGRLAWIVDAYKGRITCPACHEILEEARRSGIKECRKVR